MVNIGIVGLGRWGSNLLRCFASLSSCNVVGLCDLRLSELTWDPDLGPNDCQLTTVYEDLLNNDGIDAIVIATPPSQHYWMARRAIEAGKHVFIEKPMALDYSKALIIEERAREQQLIVHIDHLLLYHPAIIELNRLWRSGIIGDIVFTDSARLGYEPAPEEGSVIFSLLPHDISVLLYLGLLVDNDNIVAKGIMHRNHVEFITASVQGINQSSRGLHCLRASLYYPKKVRRFVMAGTKGFLLFDDTKSYEQKIMLVDIEGFATYYPCQQEEPLVNSCEAFIESIISGELSVTNATHGVMVTRILCKIQGAIK